MRRKYQLDYMKDLKILGNRVFFGKFESLGPEKLTLQLLWQNLKNRSMVALCCHS